MTNTLFVKHVIDKKGQLQGKALEGETLPEFVGEGAVRGRARVGIWNDS